MSTDDSPTDANNVSLSRVEASLDILGGTLVLAGTRIPVHDVAASVAAGLPSARIRDAYGLTEEQIQVAVDHAQANPLLDDPTELRMLREATVLSRRIKKRKLTP
jgi:uncharacterized protein (DUF433 family)